MSNAPFLLKGARWGYRMGDAEVIDSMLQEGLTCAIEGCHMGMTAEEVSRRYGVSRADQDAFAAESQRRAEAAVSSGVFDREIVPVEVPQRKGPPLRVTRDEYPRAGTTAEKLGALNRQRSRRTDGHGRQCLRHQRWRGRAGGRDGGKGERARTQTARAHPGVLHDRRRPEDHGHGTGSAMRKAVERAGLRLDDLDLIELNEAFASQSLAVVRELGLDSPRSTCTAAPSRSATRSARAAHAC